jgi:tRNA (uracil-5-)-methyltransferase TRM9
MDEKTVRALAAINRDFYRDSATAFSETRRASWPGWEPLVEWVERRLPGPALRVLDVGCGNGRFGAFLAEALPERAGDIAYCGLDASAPLLDAVRARRLPVAAVEVQLGDVIETPLESLLTDHSFSLIAVFGLLHHVPSEQKRSALLSSLARRLEPGGLLALAFWRFDDFERFRARRKPFEVWNRDSPEAIDIAQLEPGDHLLRWGEGSAAVRYCHHVDAAEGERLVAATGLEHLANYDADGREGSLNRYFLLGARGGIE